MIDGHHLRRLVARTSCEGAVIAAPPKLFGIMCGRYLRPVEIDVAILPYNYGVYV